MRESSGDQKLDALDRGAGPVICRSQIVENDMRSEPVFESERVYRSSCRCGRGPIRYRMEQRFSWLRHG